MTPTGDLKLQCHVAAEGDWNPTCAFHRHLHSEEEISERACAVCQIKSTNFLVGGNFCLVLLGSGPSSASALDPEKSWCACSLSVQSSPIFLRLSPRSVLEP